MNRSRIRKTSAALLIAAMAALGTAGCTQADRVSSNVSKDAENFKVTRRLAVLNARSDKPVFELIGAFSIEVDSTDNQLEITAKTGPNNYKKHFVGLNEWTIYVVEDVSGADVNPYRYEVSYLPEAIIPITVEDGS